MESHDAALPRFSGRFNGAKAIPFFDNASSNSQRNL